MKFRHISLVLLLSMSLLLTGCSFQMPVIVPDDKNVLDLSQSSVSDISEITVNMNGNIIYGSGEMGIYLSYEGVLRGDVNNTITGNLTRHMAEVKAVDLNNWQVISDFDVNSISVDNSVDTSLDWYLDTNGDAYYEKQKDTKWIGYSNGTSIVDISWWLSQLNDKAFKYGGKTKDSRGKSVYVLDVMYSGNDIVDLMKHMGLRMNVDASGADLHVLVYVDRWSGVPTEINVSASNTGSQIMVFDNDAMNYLSVFDFQLLLDMKTDEVVIPSDITQLDLVEPDNSLLSKGSASIDEEHGLSLHDVYVNVEANDVFDVVSYDFEKNMISVSSKKKLDGQPTMTVSLVDNMDAYTNAVSDKAAVAKFYNDLGLTELYVSQDVTQLSVADKPTYLYHTQYTEPEYGFVNTDYVAYITLSDMSFAKVIISSMVDRGVNVVLTDAYVKSMLSQISVTKAGDK